VAKISANGATKMGTWTNESGASLVLCSDGRILGKWTAGAGYSRVARIVKGDVRVMLEAADRYARRRGYSPA
jgi:hypothetical protein